MSVYIDGTPIEDFVEMRKAFDNRIDELAKESDFEGKFLKRLDINKDVAGEVTVKAYIADTQEGLIIKDIFLTSIEDFVNFLDRENLFIFDRDTLPGIMTADFADLGKIKSISDGWNYNSMLRWLEDIFCAGPHYIPNRFINRNQAELRKATNKMTETEADVFCKGILRDIQEEDRICFVYNERNWYTDYCVQFTDGTHSEFDTLDEIPSEDWAEMISSDIIKWSSWNLSGTPGALLKLFEDIPEDSNIKYAEDFLAFQEFCRQIQDAKKAA